MARVTLSRAGEDVFVGGSDVEVIGTNAGGEVITVVTGNVRLDPSFNRGGDTIVLPGGATSYTVYRAGSEVIFTRSDGSVTARIPIGSAGMEVQFDGGDSRTLLFDSSVGQATLEGQVIGTSSTSPTPVNPAGTPSASTFDVVEANTTVAEVDGGSRQLVFTITLDRTVAASDGQLTLNYQTQNGTATSGSDYVAATGQVTFAVGQQVATVTVPVNNDLSLESAETLSLVLTGARLRNGPETLVGTIDTVVVQDGAISSGLDSNFSGIKKVTYLSDGDGEDQVLVIDNDNVPASGSVLTINAGSSTETETFTFNGSSVTAYSVNVTTGAANDVINTYNGRADVISSGSGNDRISAAGGDTINAGAGADTIVLEEGNNTVFAGDGDDVIDFEDDDNIDFNSRGSNNLYGEGGDDTFFVSLSEDLTANDVIDGGVGTDTIDVIGNVVDAQFTNATNVEVLLGGNGGSVNFTLAVQAQEAGIRTINLTQGGIDVVDASAFTVGLTVSSSGGDDVITTGTGADIVTAGVGSSTINTGGGDDLIAGGLNGDILTGGAGADTFRYQTVNDSRISSGVNNRDVITDFTSGEDKIDLLTLADSTAVGQTVRFAGNFNTLGEGQAAISGTGGDAELNVVFVRDSNTLWVDVDNNAVLNDNDLQIILQGVTNLVAADVNSPQLVTAPVGSGSFGSMGDQGQTLGPRFDSLFHSEQFA